jgi:hypothetical protein
VSCKTQVGCSAPEMLSAEPHWRGRWHRIRLVSGGLYRILVVAKPEQWICKVPNKSRMLTFQSRLIGAKLIAIEIATSVVFFKWLVLELVHAMGIKP